MDNIPSTTPPQDETPDSYAKDVIAKMIHGCAAALDYFGIIPEGSYKELEQVEGFRHIFTSRYDQLAGAYSAFAPAARIAQSDTREAMLRQYDTGSIDAIEDIAKALQNMVTNVRKADEGLSNELDRISRVIWREAHVFAVGHYALDE